MSDHAKGTACDRYGHAWYSRKYGGAGCGRCEAFVKQFCVVDGRIEIHEHNAQLGVKP
jgi:hypothetical protein